MDVHHDSYNVKYCHTYAVSHGHLHNKKRHKCLNVLIYVMQMYLQEPGDGETPWHVAAAAAAFS